MTADKIELKELKLFVGVGLKAQFFEDDSIHELHGVSGWNEVSMAEIGQIRVHSCFVRPIVKSLDDMTNDDMVSAGLINIEHGEEVQWDLLRRSSTVIIHNGLASYAAMESLVKKRFDVFNWLCRTDLDNIPLAVEMEAV